MTTNQTVKMVTDEAENTHISFEDARWRGGCCRRRQFISPLNWSFRRPETPARRCVGADDALCRCFCRGTDAFIERLLAGIRKVTFLCMSSSVLPTCLPSEQSRLLKLNLHTNEGADTWMASIARMTRNSESCADSAGSRALPSSTDVRRFLRISADFQKQKMVLASPHSVGRRLCSEVQKH